MALSVLFHAARHYHQLRNQALAIGLLTLLETEQGVANSNVSNSSPAGPASRRIRRLNSLKGVFLCDNPAQTVQVMDSMQ